MRIFGKNILKVVLISLLSRARMLQKNNPVQMLRAGKFLLYSAKNKKQQQKKAI